MSFIWETCLRGHSYSWAGDYHDRRCTVCVMREETSAAVLLDAAKKALSGNTAYLKGAIELYEMVRE